MQTQINFKVYINQQIKKISAFLIHWGKFMQVKGNPKKRVTKTKSNSPTKKFQQLKALFLLSLFLSFLLFLQFKMRPNKSKFKNEK